MQLELWWYDDNDDGYDDDDVDDEVKVDENFIGNLLLATSNRDWHGLSQQIHQSHSPNDDCHHI